MCPSCANASGSWSSLYASSISAIAFGAFVPLLIGQCQECMSLMVIGTAPGDRRQEFQNLIVAASEVQCIRDVRVNEDRNGIDFPCLLQLREGFVEPAHCVEVNDIPEPGQPVAGTQRERSLEAAFG